MSDILHFARARELLNCNIINVGNKTSAPIVAQRNPATALKFSISRERAYVKEWRIKFTWITIIKIFGVHPWPLYFLSALIIAQSNIYHTANFMLLPPPFVVATRNALNFPIEYNFKFMLVLSRLCSTWNKFQISYTIGIIKSSPFVAFSSLFLKLNKREREREILRNFNCTHTRHSLIEMQIRIFIRTEAGKKFRLIHLSFLLWMIR